MAKGWQAHVYRTDLEEQYMGFFYDDTSANTWIGKQKEGTYEVSTEKPTERTPIVAGTDEAEEAPDD